YRPRDMTFSCAEYTAFLTREGEGHVAGAVALASLAIHERLQVDALRIELAGDDARAHRRRGVEVLGQVEAHAARLAGIGAADAPIDQQRHAPDGISRLSLGGVLDGLAE